MQQTHDESDGPGLGTVAIFGIAFAAVAALGLIWFAIPARVPKPVNDANSALVESPRDSLVGAFDTARRRMEMTPEQLALERPYDFVIAFPTKNVSPVLTQRNLSLREGCFDQLNANQPYRGNGSYPDRAVDPEKSVLKFDYEVAGEAFNCLLTKERHRFCDAGERATMVSAFAIYLKRYRQELKIANSTPTSAQGRMFKGLAERMKAADANPEDDDGVETNKNIPVIDEQLLHGLESVTQSGYLTVADFGGGAFPELASHILKPDSKPCR